MREPLWDLFDNVIEGEEEKEILKMVMEGKAEEDIIEEFVEE